MALNYQQALAFLLACTTSEIALIRRDNVSPNRWIIYGTRNSRYLRYGKRSTNSGLFTRTGFKQITFTMDNNIELNDIPSHTQGGVGSNNMPFNPSSGASLGLDDYVWLSNDLVMWVPSSMSTAKITSYVQAVSRNNKNYSNPKLMPIPEGKKQYPAQGYFNDFYHVRTPVY